MAAGRPVALAIDGVIRDVVETAGCGLFAAPGDAAALAGALRQLAGNREAARQMGVRGRQFLEQEFSRAAIADRLAETLRRLVP
jgi:glycosyltransferase involved in cell wall biosynthesis